VEGLVSHVCKSTPMCGVVLVTKGGEYLLILDLKSHMIKWVVYIYVLEYKGPTS
jgi:hypothetical protein